MATAPAYAVTTYRDVTVDMGSYQQVWVPRMVTQRVPQTSFVPAYRGASLPVGSPYRMALPGVPLHSSFTPATPSITGGLTYPPVSSAPMYGTPTSSAANVGPYMPGVSTDVPSTTGGYESWAPVEAANGSVVSGIPAGPVPVPPGTQVKVDDPAPSAYERRSRSGMFSPVPPGAAISRAPYARR